MATQTKKQKETALKIKIALLKKGMTQADLAKTLGLSPTTVGMVIRGQYDSSSRTVAWIKENLRIEV